MKDANQAIMRDHVPGADLRSGQVSVVNADGTGNKQVIAAVTGRYLHILGWMVASEGGTIGAVIHLRSASTNRATIVMPQNDTRGITLNGRGIRLEKGEACNVAMEAALAAGALRVTAIGFVADE